MNRLFVFLPCYNEELNIGALIDHWEDQAVKLEKQGYQLSVFCIDDCSKDRTKQVILEKAKDNPHVQLIAHGTNKGLCGGLNTSISYFMEHGSQKDCMALMDGDNTHDPKYIHAMLEKLSQKKDCVIASRYCVESSIVGVAHHREFLSDMAKYYYHAVLKVPNVKDYTCGYRVYTYEIIRELVTHFGPDPIQEKSFACMMELLYKVYLVGGQFDEVGFELRYDFKQGESKMQVLKTMRNSIFTALKLRKLKKAEE